MDVYHKVLLKLYEVTGGKDSRSLDFQDLVKSMGFHGNYSDIFERLSREGWIAEDSRRNFVRITHWGVAEAKKTTPAAPAASAKTEDRGPEACIGLGKELAELLSNLANNCTPQNLDKVEKKIAELQESLAEIKAKM